MVYASILIRTHQILIRALNSTIEVKITQEMMTVVVK